MEEDRKKKRHVCKLCNKSFLSGRILGGHMRTHRSRNSVEEDVILENSNMGDEGCYGLRENPKKSWKSSFLNDNDDSLLSVQESVECRVCGKQFESARSLHGHMRHHSVEERNGVRCKECGKGFKTVRSLTGHMRLHSLKNRVSNESRTSPGPNLVVIALPNAKTVNLVRRKRSNRTRCKVTSPNSSFSSLNESVSGFEIEHEVEEVALCLMMLSRGVYESGEFKSVGESMNTDSLSFEAKPLDESKQMGSSDGEIDVFDGDELVKKKKQRVEKFDSCASDSKNKTSEGSDCDRDMACTEEEKIQLESSTVNSYQPADSKRPEVGDECDWQLCDTEVEKVIHVEMDSSATESHSSQETREKVGLDLASLEHVIYTPSKKAVFDAEMGKDSCTEIICSTANFDDSKKKNQFQCRICSKMFLTHQALGGHQTLHRTSKSSAALKIDNCQEGIQTNSFPEKSDARSEAGKLDSIKNSVEQEEDGMTTTGYQLKKSKEHKCPICSKLFVSGQALGGHKRAHPAKAKEEQNMAMQQEVPGICEALDINLPAMIDTESNDEAGFKSCWTGTIYKHEPLLDVIAS
ncbi:zinc finger protein 600 [Ricinus communis]|uniref:Zinc finger protein, putative n=1 Tax=Ricinus communis TaxID=3988 RepID=B9SJB9_RICCO|nr:zinc finger protein 600 [Ricinus communis]EEF36282.1 zinc finger protein, putative [Ricinus communis]|eukprot:XP_002526088.1 zinc finger protein 600 [Ricinus communis]